MRKSKAGLKISPVAHKLVVAVAEGPIVVAVVVVPAADAEDRIDRIDVAAAHQPDIGEELGIVGGQVCPAVDEPGSAANIGGQWCDAAEREILSLKAQSPIGADVAYPGALQERHAQRSHEARNGRPSIGHNDLALCGTHERRKRDQKAAGGQRLCRSAGRGRRTDRAAACPRQTLSAPNSLTFTLAPPSENGRFLTVTIVSCGKVHRHRRSCRMRFFDTNGKVARKMRGMMALGKKGAKTSGRLPW